MNLPSSGIGHDVSRSLKLVSMSDWYSFKDGESIGQTGSDGGLILRDDDSEYQQLARFIITGQTRATKRE